jgi:hypothetical protein
MAKSGMRLGSSCQQAFGWFSSFCAFLLLLLLLLLLPGSVVESCHLNAS